MDLGTDRPTLGDDGLAPRQRRFAVEYLKDRNGKQAAIRAGYSAKNAESGASKLLRHPKVVAFLRARAAKVEREVMEISAERTLLELARLAYVDPGDFYEAGGGLKPIHSIPEDARRALHGVEALEERVDGVVVGEVRKVKWHDKRAALSDLAKIQGLLREKVELTGKDGGPLVFRIEEDA